MEADDSKMQIMVKDTKLKRAVLLLSALFICIGLYFFSSRVILKSSAYGEHGDYKKESGTLLAEARIVEKRKEEARAVFDLVILSEAFQEVKLALEVLGGSGRDPSQHAPDKQ